MIRRFLFIILMLFSITSLSVHAQEIINKQGQMGLSLDQLEKAKNDPAEYNRLLKQAEMMGYSKDQVEKMIEEKVGKIDFEKESDKDFMRSQDSILSRSLRQSEQGMSEIYNTDRYPEGVDGAKVMTKKDSMLVRFQDSIYIPEKTDVYGREIFWAKNLTFAPNFNIPTPKNYIVSAGDELIVNVWGDAKLSETLVVSPEGTINIDNVGVLKIGGLTIEQAEKFISNKVLQIYGGGLSDDMAVNNIEISVTLGRIRSITVNVAGEVLRPGTFTLPSLSTLLNVMYAAGGVSDIGSLREIKLYRNHRHIETLDVYDFLQNGNYESNIRLEDGDMIIVSPYKSLVSVTGNVKRERVYELDGEDATQQLLDYAGGFTGDAYKELIKVYRKAGAKSEIFNVLAKEFETFKLQDRDSVVVSPSIEDFNNRVTIKGSVWRSGEFAIDDNIKTVSELLEVAGGLRPEASRERLQVIRHNEENGVPEIESFNYDDLLSGAINDIVLERNDVVYVYSIADLKNEEVIVINGEVRYPGEFPYRDGITVFDAIQFAGGLTEAAATINVEVARRIVSPQSKIKTANQAEIFNITIDKDSKDSLNSGNFKLKPFDLVIIRRSPNYNEQEIVTIEGEVLFRGEYSMANRVTRLSDILIKAGGVTLDAYVAGARLERRFTEEEIKKVQRINELNRVDSTSYVEIDYSLLEYYSVAIDLQKALDNKGAPVDAILRDGDKIIVPQYISTVSINGAVLFPNVVTYEPGLSVRKYIKKAGGFIKSARKGNIYVVYMNGNVALGRRAKVLPGCEIVVPVKVKTGNGIEALTTGMSMLTGVTTSAALIMSLIK